MWERFELQLEQNVQFLVNRSKISLGPALRPDTQKRG